MRDTAREAAELVARAHMASFRPKEPTYQASTDPLYEVKVVAIASIQPIVRAPGVANFGEQRALSILEAIRDNTPLPPVRVRECAAANSGYPYKLHDGFHRFNLSLALGFTHLPVAVMAAPDEDAP